jgi:NDP-sugar pyrophosphorylase family protein
MENYKDMPKAVILAAGRGKRLHPYTEKYPKPLTPIADRPILEHVIYTLKNVGIREFIIVTGYLGSAIQTYFGDGSKLGVTIQYVKNPNDNTPFGFHHFEYYHQITISSAF